MPDAREALRERLATVVHRVRLAPHGETCRSGPFERDYAIADAVLAFGEIRALGRVDRGTHMVDALLMDLDPTHIVAEFRLQLPPVAVEDEESSIEEEKRRG